MPVVSSDAVRKRLAHLDANTNRRAPEHYSAGFTRATYEQLARDALLALQPQRRRDRRCDLPLARAIAPLLLDALRARRRRRADRPLRGPARAGARARRAASARSAARVRRDAADRRGAVPRLRGARRAPREQRAETRHGPDPGRAGRRDRPRASTRAARRSDGRDRREPSPAIRRNVHDGLGRVPMWRLRPTSSFGRVAFSATALGTELTALRPKAGTEDEGSRLSRPRRAGLGHGR